MPFYRLLVKILIIILLAGSLLPKGDTRTRRKIYLCLNVNLEMGLGHFIPVFAQIMGVEELYEFIKRRKMALSGLAIYKLLPKTNCKECGFPTCLAFAMKLAAKQVELAACPHVSDEAREALAAAAAPPIRLITISSDVKW